MSSISCTHHKKNLNIKYQEIDYWKPEDILDLLKLSLFKGNEQQIGRAKEVLKYRDWVAHGKNPNKLPSSTITPKLAYDRLYELTETLIAIQHTEKIHEKLKT